MKAVMVLQGGKLAGQRFDIELTSWPPPERLIGQEIHRDLVGTYEWQPEASAENPDSLLRYRLREDEDYLRILNRTARA